MAKNQGKQTTEDTEPAWIADDAADFEEAPAVEPPSTAPRGVMRHKIEDLLESRRLKKMISDYEAFDVDEKPRRVH